MGNSWRKSRNESINDNLTLISAGMAQRFYHISPKTNSYEKLCTDYPVPRQYDGDGIMREKS
jgi:hypothetical protein